MECVSDQQIQGLVVFLLGIAALVLSTGVARALGRASKVRRVHSSWYITALSFLMFVVGVAHCWFGVSALLGG